MCTVHEQSNVYVLSMMRHKHFLRNILLSSTKCNIKCYIRSISTQIWKHLCCQTFSFRRLKIFEAIVSEWLFFQHRFYRLDTCAIIHNVYWSTCGIQQYNIIFKMPFIYILISMHKIWRTTTIAMNEKWSHNSIFKIDLNCDVKLIIEIFESI